MRHALRLSLLTYASTAALLCLTSCGGGNHITGDDVSDDDDDDGSPNPDGRPPDTDGGPDIDADIDAPADANSTLTVCATGAQYTTISEAVAAAPDGAMIMVCAGTYAERFTVANKGLRIEGAGDTSTTIDAAAGGTAITLNAANVTISGFTIKRGYSTAQGGAILCNGSSLTLTGSTVRDSRAETGGGGIFGSGCIFNIDNSTFLTNEGHTIGGALATYNSTGVISNSTFTGNSADYGGALNLVDGDVDIRGSRFTMNNSRVRGGALFQQSDSSVESSVFDQNHSGWTGGAVHVNQHAPTFAASQFTNNRAEWEGGGFYLHQSHALLTDNTISHNFSIDDGGGLRIFESAARLERNMISNNRADDGDGGGYKCSHVASTFIDNMLIDNWALGAGGGAEQDNDSSIVRGGVVSGNHASIGGGFHVMLWPWNGGVIENVRILNNEAWRGGGIYFENTYQIATARGLIISGNDAHYGGGVYTRGTLLRMSNSAIYNNQSSQGGGFFVHSSYAYPWTHECPCPPIDPVADVSFVVVANNTASEIGSVAWVNAPNITFRNSIFSGHTGTAVFVGTFTRTPDPMAPPGTPPPTEEQCPPPGWRYNDTIPATFSGMGDPTGSNGNISVAPNFVNAAEGNFHLNAGSACINAGEPTMADTDGSRADQGIFGGPTPMVLQ
jgi:hypothetical protein